MIKDGQARTLRRLLSQGDSLALAARKTGMDAKSARKYRDSDGLPSQNKPPRTWRTRVDPFAEVWPEVQARLEAEPQLRAFTLFGWLQDRHKGQFCDSQRRTFERRVRQWRGTQGPGQKVMFPQVHEPGEISQKLKIGPQIILPEKVCGIFLMQHFGKALFVRHRDSEKLLQG